MPKVRWPTPCEKCKVVMPVGSRCVRFAGRRWHPTCYTAWRRERTGDTTAA